MGRQASKLQKLIDQAEGLNPIRVAVVNAAQKVLLDTLHDAVDLGFVEPILIGEAKPIRDLRASAAIEVATENFVETTSDTAAAAAGVRLVREGKADVLMKGLIHTDALMHALLDAEHGLRVPGRRVSHAFLCDIPSYSKLLIITDAAINIAPDLNAKTQILQNAIELCHLLGVETPKVAVLSAVETVNPAIASTIDAACLTLMAQRGQITAAIVDGPLAFDNAISLRAAKEKGIASKVAGDCDILLVPDLVSGNILAKNLEYLADAIPAGIVLGLSAPVVLSSRSDPAPARLAALALAALIHDRTANLVVSKPAPVEPTLQCAPQPESACHPLTA
ncbi:MAG: bifunctional enoyl-CoA hydratase/phosphate acetyltransferase [Hyphomicrobium sp.]|uniref:bifunctional enoyl-CoA hydratase/phosphate acetyltransferase n=1 Tax=Hyphomicrobium sp. TaxID=82 RepID=UPI001322ECF1|nr:bifunctional enoyl-CoA hydratase/phosphate acetyltransferase [Hyphomicrobium sp.]KAB2943548.1 MAG: bifunctional enoyl-CoA hydratase/phosphate acetyltransferase [Hyphomicrobium sp.]MBZ0209737.1 bifunctional enoyl-CoA hydratase/phosphate acetyltransferase [Hyphomicrobium sp.]